MGDQFAPRRPLPAREEPPAAPARADTRPTMGEWFEGRRWALAAGGVVFVVIGVLALGALSGTGSTGEARATIRPGVPTRPAIAALLATAAAPTAAPEQPSPTGAAPAAALDLRPVAGAVVIPTAWRVSAYGDMREDALIGPLPAGMICGGALERSLTGKWVKLDCPTGQGLPGPVYVKVWDLLFDPALVVPERAGQ